MADFGDETEGFERTAPVRRPSVAPTTQPRRPNFERLADYDEARMAFERALQARWARRMQRR